MACWLRRWWPCGARWPRGRPAAARGQKWKGPGCSPSAHGLVAFLRRRRTRHGAVVARRCTRHAARRCSPGTHGVRLASTACGRAVRRLACEGGGPRLLLLELGGPVVSLIGTISPTTNPRFSSRAMHDAGACQQHDRVHATALAVTTAPCALSQPAPAGSTTFENETFGFIVKPLHIPVPADAVEPQCTPPVAPAS